MTACIATRTVTFTLKTVYFPKGRDEKVTKHAYVNRKTKKERIVLFTKSR